MKPFVLVAAYAVLSLTQPAVAGIATGACNLPDGTCRVLSDTACAVAGGAYQGDGTACPVVPAVSTWGVVVMTLLLLAVGTIVLTRTRHLRGSVLAPLFVIIICVGQTDPARSQTLRAPRRASSHKAKVSRHRPVRIPKADPPRRFSLLVSPRPAIGGGVQQVIRVMGDPPAQATDTSTPPASTVVCPQVGTVEVLATQMSFDRQDGLGPIPSPMRVDLQINTGAPTPLFAGADVAVGMMESAIPFGATGDTITFTGKAAFPSFADPSLHSMQIANDNAVNAIILTNTAPSNNYFTLAAAKGVKPAFDGQMAVTDILAAFVDPVTGNVTLADNEMLILYELGTTNTQSTAFDFQDLILKITTDCQVVQEVALRCVTRHNGCTSGLPDAVPDGSSLLSSFINSLVFNFASTAVRLDITQTTEITRFAMVGDHLSDLPAPANDGIFNTQLIVHSSEQAFANNALSGDVFNSGIALTSVQPSGLSFEGNRFYLTEDVNVNNPLILTPGLYIISLPVDMIGQWSYAESSIDLPMGEGDIITASGLVGSFIEADTFVGANGYVTSTASLDIFGVVTGP